MDNKNEALETQPKKKKNGSIKYIISILFMLTLITITIIVICTSYDMNEVWNVISTVRLRWINISLVMIFIYVLFEGLATRKILQTMGERTSIVNNFCYAAIDYYFCAVTPSATGGQPMAAYYMTKDKIPLTKTSITLLINTAMFKIVLLTLSIAAFIAGFFMANNYVLSNGLVLGLFIFGFLFNIGFVILCFLVTFKRKWVEAIGDRIILLGAKLNIKKLKNNKIKIFRKFKIKMDEYEVAAKHVVKHKWRFSIALLYNFIQRIALFSIGFFVFLAFYETSELGRTVNGQIIVLEWHNYFELLFIQVIIALSVDSLPLPGGVGISEFLFTFLLSLVYVVSNNPDLNDSVQASAMLFTRAVSFYVPVISCCIIWLIKHIIVLVRAKKQPGSKLDVEMVDSLEELVPDSIEEIEKELKSED